MKRTRRKNKPGPKPFWKESLVNQVYLLARFGMTDKELAEFFEISLSTINSWKQRPEFKKALQDGRVVSSTEVIDAIYQRALGYTYDEITEEYKIIKGKEILVSKKVTNKRVLPNLTAAIYLMRARHGDKWDPEIKFSGKLTGALTVDANHHLDLTGLNTEEQKLLKSVGFKQLLKAVNEPSGRN